jgi:endonuclease/exonuclease/phosphatase (EEP) superfamily protein YafD
VRRHRRLWVPLVLLALLPLGATIAEQRWTTRELPGPGKGASLSLLHWNVCRGYGGWHRIATEIASGDPDLVILSEVMTVEDGGELAGLLPRLPYRQYAFPMLVLSRFPLAKVEQLERSEEIKLYALELEQDGARWSFFALDVAGSARIPREPALRLLAGAVAGRRPDFLAGDFNTPRGSRLLTPLAAGYRHAYDIAGSGWSPTWPTLLPILAIDHLYVEDDAVEVNAYASSPFSDHRLQRATLRRRS